MTGKAAARLPHSRGESGRGAFAPEEVGREADEKQKDCDGEIPELGRVAEGEIDGIADDGCGDKNEDQGCPGIAGNAIGKRPTGGGAANGENGRGG